MKTFTYKAIKSDGETINGEKTANQKGDVSRELEADGSMVISIEEKKTNSFGKIEFSFGRVKEQEKIVFAKNLGKMIGAGLPVMRALEIMEKQSKGKFQKALLDISEGVSKGDTLSATMKNHPHIFSALFIAMVSAGEESGNLSESLAIISGQMERTYVLKKKIKGAMMYPAIILFAMVVIAILMLIFIVPTLTATFSGLNVELPLSTRFLIGSSNLLRYNIIASIFSMVAIVVVAGIFFRSKRGMRVLDFVFLHVPLISDITKKINSARTARTLSSLLSSGVEYVSAVGITGEVIQNSYYREIIADAGNVIVKGGSISETFEKNSKFYPLFVSEMAKVGEETGKLSEMLLEVAKFYEEEVEQRTKDMSTVIEPFLMILIGTAVGFFALAMMSPMYSLADKI